MDNVTIFFLKRIEDIRSIDPNYLSEDLPIYTDLFENIDNLRKKDIMIVYWDIETYSNESE